MWTFKNESEIIFMKIRETLIREPKSTFTIKLTVQRKMPIPILDLDNFESDIAEGCEYVLTSPRSLQACSKLKLKPVQLLKVKLKYLTVK